MATFYVDMMNRMLGKNWCGSVNSLTFSIPNEIPVALMEQDASCHRSAMQNVISAFKEAKLGGFLFFKGQKTSSGEFGNNPTRLTSVYAIFLHPKLGIRFYCCFDPSKQNSTNSVIAASEKDLQMRLKIEQELNTFVQAADAFNFVLDMTKRSTVSRDLSNISSCAQWIEALLKEFAESTIDCLTDLRFQQAVSEIASNLLENNVPFPYAQNDFRQNSVHMMNKFYDHSWRSNTLTESTVILPAICPREKYDFQSSVRKAFEVAKIGGVLIAFIGPLSQFHEELDIHLPDHIKVWLQNLSNTFPTSIDLTKALLFFHSKLGFSWIIENSQSHDHERIGAQLNVELICLSRALQLKKWFEGVENRPYIAAMHFQGSLRGQHVSHVAENFKAFLSTSQIDLSENIDFQRLVACIVGIRTYRRDPLQLPKQIFLTTEQLAYTESTERIKVLHGEPECGKTSTLLSKILALLKSPLLKRGSQIDICVFNAQDYKRMKIVVESFVIHKMMKPNIIYFSETFEKQAISHVNTTTAEFVFFDAVESIPYKINKKLWMQKPKNMRVIGGIENTNLQHVTIAMKSQLTSGLQHPKRVFQWYCLSIRFGAEDKKVKPEIEKESTDDNKMVDDKFEFIAKCVNALDNFYPHWQAGNFEKTIFLPPSIDLDKTTLVKAERIQDQKQNQLQNEKSKENGRLSAETGAAAEETLSQAFAKLKLGGIVILGFNTRLLLNKIGQKDAKLSPRQIKLMKELVGAKTTEIDFLLCHPQIGIVVIEVKGAQKVFFGETGHLFNAKEQLSKITGLIPEMYKIFTGSEFNIPLTSGICFPFASVPENEFPTGNWAFIDKGIMEDPIKFANFWKLQLDEAGNQNLFLSSSQEISSFCQFIAAIAGYRQVEFVSSQVNALEIYRTLDTQIFLDGKGPGKRKGSARTDPHSSKTDLQSIEIVTDGIKQAFFLNVQQSEILAKNYKRQIIFGPPGTGKSLLIYFQALNAAKEESTGRILFQTRPSLLKHAQQFFSNNIDPQAKRRVTVVDSLFTNEFDVEADDCFLDEAEFGKDNMAFYDRRSSRPGKTIIAITGGLMPTEFQSTPQKLAQIITSAAYELIELKAVVRGTKNIIEYWAAEIPNYSVTIGHNCLGAIVDKTDCITSDLVLKELHLQLQRFFPSCVITKGNAKFKPKHIAIIAPDPIEAEKVRCYLASHGIKCGSSEEQMNQKTESLIVVDVPENVLSQEWPVVIALSILSMDYYPEFRLICASRAIAHLTIIERDYQSAYAALQKYIDENLGDQLANTPMLKFGEVVSLAHKNIGEDDAQVFQFDALSIYIRMGYGAVGFRPFEPFKLCTTLSNVLQVINDSHSLLCDTILSTGNAKNALNNFANRRQSWAGDLPLVLRSFKRKKTKFLDHLMQAHGLQEVFNQFMDLYCTNLPVFASQMQPDGVIPVDISEEERQVIDTYKYQAEWMNFVSALDLALNSSILNVIELGH